MHVNTPLIKSLPLSELTGSNIWLKLDAMQPSGSFKLRGMGAKARMEVANGAKKFVSSSGGNAGLGVAWAGMELGIPVSVYVPETTRKATIDQLRLCGAEVIVIGDQWATTHQHAMQEVDGRSTVYFHPFDDPLVWQGHASLIDEIVLSGLRPDWLVCSVGGGGLLCGMMQGLAANDLHQTQVLALETTGADALNCSLEVGHVVTLEKITSKASSLGANRVCDQAYEYASGGHVVSDRVTDDIARKACASFLEDHRVRVEMACGAALAAAYECHPSICSDDERDTQPKNVLIVVCGGGNASS